MDKLFTPAAVLDMLIQIEELKDKTVGMSETLDGDLQLQIGDSVYLLNADESTDVEIEVSESDIDKVETANAETYDKMESDDVTVDVGTDDSEPLDLVESGIIKELAKTLMIGGIVRLGSKLLK